VRVVQHPAGPPVERIREKKGLLDHLADGGIGKKEEEKHRHLRGLSTSKEKRGIKPGLETWGLVASAAAGAEKRGRKGKRFALRVLRKQEVLGQ